MIVCVRITGGVPVLHRYRSPTRSPDDRRPLRMGSGPGRDRPSQGRSAGHGRRGPPRPPARAGAARRPASASSRSSTPARSSRSAAWSARPTSPPVPGDALVAGSGRINGRPALAGAEDVTVLGGSIGSGASDKRYRLCQLARQERVPLVMMLEGAGHRVTETAGRAPTRRPDGSGRTVRARAPGRPGARGLRRSRRAHRPAVRLRGHDGDGVDLRRRSAAGAVGHRRGRHQGGARAAPRSPIDSGGVVHNVVADDGEAIDLARRYLGHFPLNAWEAPPRR